MAHAAAISPYQCLVGQHNVFLSINDGIVMCWITLPAGTLQRHQQCAAAGVTTAAASWK